MCSWMNEIKYDYSTDSIFYGWIRLRKGWDFIIVEPFEEDELSYQRKRFIMKEADLEKLEHVMNEVEFKEFALKGIQWRGDCDQCSWGPYSEVYVVVPMKEEGKGETYQALRLASVIIDVD